MSDLELQRLALDALQAWGRWVRDAADPLEHLQIRDQPMFRFYRPAWRESQFDRALLYFDNGGFDPDLAYDVNQIVFGMRCEIHKVYLVAFFCEYGSKRKIAKAFRESDRSVDTKIANAVGAFEVLYFQFLEKPRAKTLKSVL